MAISISQCGAVILAGGRSRRMGTCKALLPWHGTTLVSHIHHQLAPFHEIWLSANDPLVKASMPLPCVADIYPDAGPLGGLHAAFSATQKQYLLCVACDMPHFQQELAVSLMQNFPKDAQAFVCRDSTGRIHPLCGIYDVSTLPILVRQLESHNFCVMAFLDQITCAEFDAATVFPDSTFYNMNTLTDYQEISETK